ncbi:hypothetical protein [Pseudopontixanthobacter vadosimaris]|uniref:hypothetical protein n=1 Tax=Pseudopontixanthobacter vadosimaris TaxID=2726450 RepID=UPI0014736319|nr:hypothetical protein [Pseudopontixanthobacter vadosimaris]
MGCEQGKSQIVDEMANLVIIDYHTGWAGDAGKRSMRYVWLCIAAATMTSVAACVPDSQPSASHFADYKPFDLETRADFSGYEEVVGSYLRKKAVGVNTHACVIGLTRGPRESEAVWIIWRRGDRLISWFSGENNLDLSSRNLSLTKDVVPTDSEVGSSTYLVSRAWVDELERLCKDHGHRVKAAR